MPAKGSRTGIVIKCKICSKDTYVRPSKIGRTKFCSVSCRIKGKNPKPKTGKFINCFSCSKEIWVRPYRQKSLKKFFCSKQCMKKFDFGGKIKLKCKFCGKDYETYKSHSRLRGSSFCSYKCMYSHKRKNMIVKKKSSKSRNGVLKKQLWLYFSKYIRQRDRGICISCGKVDDWRNTDAGHYIPKTYGLSIYFDERNVNCQCTGCNRFRHGNLSSYAIALMNKYGEDILKELDRKKREIIKISDEQYIQKIQYYKDLLDENGFEFTSNYKNL